MKTCIRIPRILLPEQGFEKWSVIACDQFTSDRAYWARVKENVGDEPSTLNFILPEVYLGEEDEERIAEIHGNMYAALESEKITKLNRGIVFTERTTVAGIRRGIVASIDLEAYTCNKGELSPIRSSEEVVPSRLPARVAVRRGAPLEFPHALIFYKDKKNRAVRTLLHEELEVLYDFDLMEGGGRLKGYFVPEYLATGILPDLYSRTEPSFAVADGNHSVAAAKAYWEEVKIGLTEKETRNHPARFTLVELVNLYDDAVVFHPIHRLVTGIDPEAFCDYFKKSVKCKRKGNVLYPALGGSAESVEKADALIETFVKQNGGKIDYIHGEKELCGFANAEDCAGVALKAIEKDGFFERLKDGGNFPKKTFSVGEDIEKRYYTEGREISYD
jgi:hypothetical protein